MKIFSILLVYVLLFVLQTTSCQEQVGPITKLNGPNDQVELVFFYKKDVSQDQKEFFENNILHENRQDGKGYYSREGVLVNF